VVSSLDFVFEWHASILVSVLVAAALPPACWIGFLLELLVDFVSVFIFAQKGLAFVLLFLFCLRLKLVGLVPNAAVSVLVASRAAGFVLELAVTRLEFSQVLTVLPWWILGHTRKVFIEMCVRQ
jgi:hypothetical protein